MTPSSISMLRPPSCSADIYTVKKPMFKVTPTSFVVAVVILIFGLSGSPLNAQQSRESGTQQVFSVNPFGLLLEFFNAEYERVISETSTIGFGGSTLRVDNETWSEPPITGYDEYGDPIYDYQEYDGLGPDVEHERYINADVFWRYYPSGTPLNGWAFGVKAGITTVFDHATYFGYGFDLNRSWVLGPDDNFYVGVGFGLKRLYGAADEDYELKFIPTIRIVNVGIAF